MASAYERVSPKQAAEMLGISIKAIQQAISRGRFPNIEREQAGKVNRVYIPRSDVEAYADSRGITLNDSSTSEARRPVATSEARPMRASEETAPRPDSKRRSPAPARQGGSSSQAQQQVLEELSSEIVGLRVRVRELEAELE